MSAPRIKRIYEPATPDDGQRFLVDRLWPRGISKERAELVAWLKDLAPSTELRRDFHDAGYTDEDWRHFQSAYFDQLDQPGPQADAELRQLRQAIAKGPVTLLFGSRNTQRNNAVALAEWLAR